MLSDFPFSLFVCFFFFKTKHFPAGLGCMRINAQVKHDFIRMTSHKDSFQIRSKWQLRNDSLISVYLFIHRVLRFSPLLKNQHFQIPIRSWYARTLLNEFL